VKECLKVIVLEQVDRIRVWRPARVPSYILMVGCPPDVDQNPGYYDL
jgi:hypothetical protein